MLHNSRSKSISSSSPTSNFNIMMFSPPTQYKSVLRTRFEDLLSLPKHMQQTLPPLPSPLSRICQRDGTLCSQGMYPLISPRPILQKSSYQGPIPPKEQSLNSATNEITSKFPLPCRVPQQGHLSPTAMANTKSKAATAGPGAPVMSMPLSLTDSFHHANLRINNKSQQAEDLQEEIDDVTRSDDSPPSSPSSLSATPTTRSVHFDPRVTITEYDDEVPRKWYRDSDLEQFKSETIDVAQRYLMRHPDVAAEYCTGTVDPSTGIIRKKTLYSLPILNDVSLDVIDSSWDEKRSNTISPPSSYSQTLSYDYAYLASMHVRKILIVDPNKLIVDLFCKSMLLIFPHAELSTAQTGEDALHELKQVFLAWLSQPYALPRGFDLIIMEENLNGLPLPGFRRSLGQARTSEAMSGESQSNKFDASTTRQSKKYNSTTSLADLNTKTNDTTPFHPKLISGAEV